jgi:3-deoxy-7-phosphoheptulonate synthase
MIITMQLEATQAQIDAVVQALQSLKIEPLVLPGEDRVAIGIPATLTQELKERIETALGSLDGINQVAQTSRPYKLASIEFHRQKTRVQVGQVEIGPDTLTVFAGPCSIESYDQFVRSAEVVAKAGAQVLRGGAFKPRTSPYAFQGLAEEGLKIMRKVGESFGLPTITEVMSGDLVPMVAEYADILQIGARSMQNFPLLIEAGKSKKPVFLKRGPSATLDEFLLASEYVLAQGNPNVILCERGVMPIDRGYLRNTLDLAIVPVLKEVTHLPVVADPSHGTGVARFVGPMAKAAIAAGADGVMIEMHPNPPEALSDGAQSLNPNQFLALVAEMKRLNDFMRSESVSKFAP